MLFCYITVSKFTHDLSKTSLSLWEPGQMWYTENSADIIIKGNLELYHLGAIKNAQ